MIKSHVWIVNLHRKWIPQVDRLLSIVHVQSRRLTFSDDNHCSRYFSDQSVVGRNDRDVESPSLLVKLPLLFRSVFNGNFVDFLSFSCWNDDRKAVMMIQSIRSLFTCKLLYTEAHIDTPIMLAEVEFVQRSISNLQFS